MELITHRDFEYVIVFDKHFVFAKFLKVSYKCYQKLAFNKKNIVGLPSVKELIFTKKVS